MSRKQTACDEIGHINNGLNMTKSQREKRENVINSSKEKSKAQKDIQRMIQIQPKLKFDQIIKKLWSTWLKVKLRNGLKLVKNIGRSQLGTKLNISPE